jgi:hypothetical protein
MRQTCWLTFLFLTVVPFWGVLADDNDSRQAGRNTDRVSFARAEEMQILQTLSKQITLRCEDTELDDAVEQISQLIDLDILICQRAFDEEGISQKVAMTMDLGALTARQALHFLLKSRKLTWVASDGVLEVTTEFDSEQHFITRVHNVSHLCKLMATITNETYLRYRRTTPDPQPMGLGNGMMGMVKRAMFNVPPELPATAAIDPVGEQKTEANLIPPAPVAKAPKTIELVLAHMICDHSSLSWKENDGMGGTVALGDGCLIISQTFQGHLEIAGMLQALERLVEGGAPEDTIVAHKTGYPSEEDAKVLAILAKPTSLEIKEGPLSETLVKIAQEAGLRLWFDQNALNEEGINTEEELGSQRRIRSLPLGVSLRKMLEPRQLTIMVEEGTLVVTTLIRAQESMTVQFYDVGEPSKITCHEQLDGLVSVIRAMSREEWDEELAYASFVSDRHLVVRQSPQAQVEIARFIADLRSHKLAFPIDPIQLELQLRVYTAPDIDTASDLERVLPQLLETRWTERGSIRRVGASLILNQPQSVQDAVEKIMTKLEQSHAKRNPPPVTEDGGHADQPMVPETRDDRVQ